ncbi:hypothetical protein DES53_112105 [Roseimicrobium gellanilyticum]|uniref:Peptidase C39-like protein n=2 Tax=Roseimicrobium gellanilyticum TaxID=748857 RepID=A0A366HAC7_9BACT|nr:hypothetical protein DES53_112105 [Roseimicrobium gellanilyticum]
MRRGVRVNSLALAVSLFAFTQCAQKSLGHANVKIPEVSRATQTSPLAFDKPTPIEQQTRHDCGIAALEHAAKLWGVDLSAKLPLELRVQPSSLASLATLAKRHGFEAYVMQAGSEGLDPYKEVNLQLADERPLILLLRFPPSIGGMWSYIRAVQKSPDFHANPSQWQRHFVVLTASSGSHTNGIAQKYTLMDPASGRYRNVGMWWLDLFWRRQDAKYLLIGK